MLHTVLRLAELLAGACDVTAVVRLVATRPRPRSGRWTGETQPVPTTPERPMALASVDAPQSCRLRAGTGLSLEPKQTSCVDAGQERRYTQDEGILGRDSFGARRRERLQEDLKRLQREERIRSLKVDLDLGEPKALDEWGTVVPKTQPRSGSISMQLFGVRNDIRGARLECPTTQDPSWTR